MWMNVIVGVTLVMLVVGWTYATSNAPVRWPQQTDWFNTGIHFFRREDGRGRALEATYDEASETLEMKVQATNVVESDIELKQLTIAMATFVNGPEPSRPRPRSA